jgi:membrane-associated phospholipid phosphatase
VSLVVPVCVLALSLNALATPVAAQDVVSPSTAIAPTQPASTIARTPASDTIGTSTPSFEVPTLGELFRSVGTDFRNLPSRENAILLAIGASLAGVSKPQDREIAEDWTKPSSTDKFFKPGAIIGDSFVNVGAAFAFYGIGRATHNPRIGLFGADLVRAQILTQSTTFALKFAVDRTRPNGDPRSFPSGHTSTAFATATVVQQHFGWRAGIPAYAVAAYVGASRIQDNKHYLSDVAFGAALGIVAGRTATIGYRGMKFALTPVGGPSGGIGVGLTRVK